MKFWITNNINKLHLRISSILPLLLGLQDSEQQSFLYWADFKIFHNLTLGQYYLAVSLVLLRSKRTFLCVSALCYFSEKRVPTDISKMDCSAEIDCWRIELMALKMPLHIFYFDMVKEPWNRNLQNNYQKVHCC